MEIIQAFPNNGCQIRLKQSNGQQKNPMNYFKMNSPFPITLEAEEYPKTVFSILVLPQCFKIQHFKFFIGAFSPDFSISAVSHFCWPWCNMYCTSLLCAVSIYSSPFSDMLSRSQAVPICAQGYQLIDLQMYNHHHCSRLMIFSDASDKIGIHIFQWLHDTFH